MYHRRISLARFSYSWWRHNLLLITSQWPDNCNAITWIAISNSLDIDFIHGDIHGPSCKKCSLHILVHISDNIIIHLTFSLLISTAFFRFWLVMINTLMPTNLLSISDTLQMTRCEEPTGYLKASPDLLPASHRCACGNIFTLKKNCFAFSFILIV